MNIFANTVESTNSLTFTASSYLIYLFIYLFTYLFTYLDYIYIFRLYLFSFYLFIYLFIKLNLVQFLFNEYEIKDCSKVFILLFISLVIAFNHLLILK